MKTMCPPGYHQNGFMATHAFGHMMNGYTLLVTMNQSVNIYVLYTYNTFESLALCKLKGSNTSYNLITFE